MKTVKLNMELIKKAIAPGMYFLLAVLALWQSVFNPMLNWDMIGYMAAAKAYEEPGKTALHSFTYEQLRKSVSPRTFERLVSRGGNAYRETMSSDPAAFAEQLPFYRIRPVYTGLIYLLYKAGIRISSATHLLSGIAVAAATVLLYFLAQRFLAGALVCALPPLALVFGVVDLARFSTPDGLAFCSMVLAAYLLMTERTAALLIFLPVMIGIRTDLMLFVMPLLAFLLFADKTNRWKTMLCALAAIAAYICIVNTWQGHGWETTFYFTLVKPLAHPASMPPVLTVRDYFHELFGGVKALPGSKVLMLYGLVAAYSLRLISAGAKTVSTTAAVASPLCGLILTCLFFVASHFILLPAVWDRFYSGAGFMGTFALMAVLTENISQKRRKIERDSIQCVF